MYRILILALLLSLAGPVFATGQEMAGLVTYIVIYFSLLVGLVLGSVIVLIMLLVAWRKGTLGKYPGRIALASVAIMAGAPALILSGFLLFFTSKDMRKYPGQHAWLTGWKVEDVTAPQSTVEPPVDLLTQARNGLATLSQDIVRAWHYDPAIEEAERRASQDGTGADEK